MGTDAGAAPGGLTFTAFVDDDQEEWARFVDGCDEAWLYHHPTYLRHWSTFANDQSFSIRVDGKMVGVCALSNTRIGLGGILEGPGLALAPISGAHETRVAALKHLRAIAARLNCQALQFRISPLTPSVRSSNYAQSTLAEMGFGLGETRYRFTGDTLASVVGYATLIDLDLDMDSILKDFSKGHRANVGRCAKTLSVRTTTGAAFEPGLFRDFILVLGQTLSRHGERLYPPYVAFLEAMTRSGFMTVLAAYQGDTCVAAALIATYKGGAYYFRGGSTSEGLSLGAMTFLQHRAMAHFKQNGFDLYNVGVTYPALESSQRGNVGAFKKRFGGRKVDDLSGELMLDRNRYILRILLPKLISSSGLAPAGLRRMAARALNRPAGRGS